jgi:hypothetical protein
MKECLVSFRLSKAFQGDRLTHLKNMMMPYVSLNRCSAIFIRPETFWVMRGTTVLDPESFVNALQTAEIEFKKLDPVSDLRLVLLVYEGLNELKPGQVIPHPTLFEDPLTFKCAREVWPSYYHPIFEKTLEEMTREIGLSDAEEFYISGKTAMRKFSLI